MQDGGESRITPFGRYLGVELIGAADGRAEARLRLRDVHRNRRGVAHGGVIASLLDTALGAAVISSMRPEEWCGTVQLSLQFNDPARGGELMARGRMLRRGRTVAFAEGEIVDEDGKVVARAHGTWTIWPRHPDAEADPEQDREP